jgi:hypothetical protein
MNKTTKIVPENYGRTNCGRGSGQRALFLSAILATLLCAAIGARAQGTAFTYQGRLNDGANPANGSYDLTFTLFDTASGGNQVGGVLTNTATAVSNGLFTLVLDFGAGAFTGADRWLEVGASTNGAGTFATLSPRQQVLSLPTSFLSFH